MKTTYEVRFKILPEDAPYGVKDPFKVRFNTEEEARRFAGVLAMFDRGVGPFSQANSSSPQEQADYEWANGVFEHWTTRELDMGYYAQGSLDGVYRVTEEKIG